MCETLVKNPRKGRRWEKSAKVKAIRQSQALGKKSTNVRCCTKIRPSKAVVKIHQCQAMYSKKSYETSISKEDHIFYCWWVWCTPSPTLANIGKDPHSEERLKERWWTTIIYYYCIAEGEIGVGANAHGSKTVWFSLLLMFPYIHAAEI
jgi:hypothetical protein